MKKLIIILLLGINVATFASFFHKDKENKTIEDISTEKKPIFSYEHYMEKGNKSYSNEDYDKSLKFYMEAFKLKENDIDALTGIANSYEKLELHDRALGVYRKILKLSPGNTNSQRRYLMLNAGNVPKWGTQQQKVFFEKFENYLKKNNYSNSEDIYTLGRTYMNNKTFEKAYATFIKDKNGDYRNYFGAATTARFLGKYDTSIAYYKKLLAVKPDFYRGYIGLGNSYKLTGNYTAAIENLKKSLVYKKDENIYVGIANIYIAQDEFNKAKQILEEGQSKFPNSVPIRKSLGELYSRNK